MIKRILTVAMAVFLSVTLSGCKDLKEEARPNDKRLVSAVGFSEKGGETILYVEAVEAIGEGKVKTHVIKESGDNLGNIFTETEAQSSGELTFDHCDALVLDKTVSDSSAKEILEDLIAEERIPLSTKVVFTNDIDKLFEFKGDGEETTGFEISDLAESFAEMYGFAAHSTLYEIGTSRMQTVNIYALPVVNCFDSILDFEGMMVYVDDMPSAMLDYKQSLSYAVLRNIFEGGDIKGENGVYHIESANSKIYADFTNDRLRVDIKVYSKPKNEELVNAVKETVKDFDSDIFGISNAISAKYPDVWRKIRNAYDVYFKDAEINISGE